MFADFARKVLLDVMAESMRWHRQHEKVLDTAGDARRNGYPSIAEMFDRHAQSLLSRIEALRSAVHLNDSCNPVSVELQR